jgi:tetratricopeptide (TPR) repeat protein
MKKNVFLISVLIVLSTGIRAQELSMNAKLMTVYNLVGNEQYALALFQIDEILAEDSTNINGLIFGGLCYQNLGDKDDAIFYYNKAIYHDPENADVHYLKGECLMSLEQYDKARESFEKALYYQSDYYKAYIELAKIDRMNKNYQEAEKKLVFVAKNQVYNLEAYKELSELFIEIGDTALALNVISQALMIQPDNKESLKLRIGLLYDLEIYEGLLYDLDIYLKLDDRDADMFFKRGKAHLFTGDTISALRDFNDAIYLDKELWAGYYYRAITRNALYDKDGACKDIQMAKDKGVLPDPRLFTQFCTPEESEDEIVEENDQN